MKTLKYGLLAAITVACSFISCDTDIENIKFNGDYTFDKASLLSYKATDHEIMFGWFGYWTGGDATPATALKSLPDSMDLVSLWSDWQTLTDIKIEDLRTVKEEKGFKVVPSFFLPKLGDRITPEGEDQNLYWGYDPSKHTDESEEAAWRKYAKTLITLILDKGYDGIDIDNEPENSGNIFNNPRLTYIFFDELSKYVGPRSGTKHILMVNSNGYIPSNMSGLPGDLFNYWAFYDYTTGSYTTMDQKVDILKNGFGLDRATAAKKLIATADFERFSAEGGYPFKTRDGRTVPGLQGLSEWRPVDENGKEIPKAGAGVFHIEADYKNQKGDYYFVRNAIQIMNPAKANK